MTGAEPVSPGPAGPGPAGPEPDGPEPDGVAETGGAAGDRPRMEPVAVLEEAARLAGVAGSWARRAMPELAAVLRGERPDVTGKLVEAGAAVAAAARAVVESLVRPPVAEPAAPATDPLAGPAEAAADTAQRQVQRIDVS